ncbi:DUF2946 family protein [Lysobacter tyrosinilyticus]
MRNPTFQLRMALLALVATLLLVLVPTVGRVLSSASDASSGVWAQMCTMAGLKLVKLAPGDANPLTPKPSPVPTGGDAMQDCAYCPLLNAMAVLVLWVVLAFPQVVVRALRWWRAPVRYTRWYPCGLGSRGPPLAA